MTRILARAVSVLGALAASLVGLTVAAPSASAADPVPGTATAPFAFGQQWNACEGYDGVGNWGELWLAFSPDCGDGAAGQPVVAMKDGQVASYDSYYGSMCVNATGGGSYGYVHISQGQPIGASVKAGQRIGTVGAPNQYHVITSRLTVEAFSGSGCAGTQVPFDEAHGWRICGAPDMIAGVAPTEPGMGSWGRTAFFAKACNTLAPAPSIRGALEVGDSPVAGRVHVKGWAYDPTDPTAALKVSVQVSNGPQTNAELHELSADVARADIADAYPGIGAHGFDATFDTTILGAGAVSVTVVNTNTNATLFLGETTTTIIDPTPAFAYEVAASEHAQMIHVVGWVFDPRALGSAYHMYAYVGAASQGEGAEVHDLGLASLSRPDIDTHYPGMGGDHGFDVTFSTQRLGDQPVYLYAWPDPGAADMRYQTLGSKQVTIATLHTMSVTVNSPRAHVLRADVNPNWAAGNYGVIVQRKSNGHWARVKKVQTSGALDRITLTVRAGKYRVIVSRPDFRTQTSAAVVVR